MFLKLHQANEDKDDIYVNMDQVTTITPHSSGTQIEGRDFVIWVTESAESIVDRCITLAYGMQK